MTFCLSHNISVEFTLADIGVFVAKNMMNNEFDFFLLRDSDVIFEVENKLLNS